MADYRTKPETELTFYTYSQPEGKFNISRYDTLDDAINKFKEDIDLSSFSGIGISKNGRSELDIVHKRDTTPVLVTDYTKVDAFKCDREYALKFCAYIDELLKQVDKAEIIK